MPSYHNLFHLFFQCFSQFIQIHRYFTKEIKVNRTAMAILQGK